jgi:hypothetical protein
VWIATALWFAGVVAGLVMLASYDNTPGGAAAAPGRWPDGSALGRAKDGPTLVLVAHPHCSCTRTSIAELGEALARTRTQPRTYVLFVKPGGFEAGWEETDLWRRALALPAATLVRDDEGRESRRFGAVTSGTALLYDETGRLLFSGGITRARSHAGDSPGRRALVALLNREPAADAATHVFGCALFAAGS